MSIVRLGSTFLAISLLLGLIPTSSEANRRTWTTVVYNNSASSTKADAKKWVTVDYTDRVHKATCKLAYRLPKEDRIYYDSKEAALEDGYVLCRICNPQEVPSNFGPKKQK